MACVWYGVQSWIGGQCVTLMIRAIVSLDKVDVSSHHRTLLTTTCSGRRSILSTTESLDQARPLEILLASSFSGSGLYQPFTSQSTRFDISLQSRHTLCHVLAWPFLAGPLQEHMESVLVSTMDENAFCYAMILTSFSCSSTSDINRIETSLGLDLGNHEFHCQFCNSHCQRLVSVTEPAKAVLHG